MTPELLTGIVGAVGAIFGAGGVVTGQVLTARHQRMLAREQAEVARRQRQEDAQREACLTLLTTSAEFEATTWQLMDELGRQTPDVELCAAARTPYLDSWRGFLRARHSVEALVTEPLVGKARALGGAVTDTSNAIDDWYRRAQQGSTYGTSSRAASCADKLQDLRNARDAFSDTVSGLLNDEASRAELPTRPAQPSPSPA
ncbi:hypothetical protein ACWGDS_33520 [Streptomyces sp. NPDC055059]